MNSAAWNSLLIWHLPFSWSLPPPSPFHPTPPLYHLSFRKQDWNEPVSKRLVSPVLLSTNDTQIESLCLLSNCAWQKLTGEIRQRPEPQDFLSQTLYGFIYSFPCTTFSVISAFFSFSLLERRFIKMTWYRQSKKYWNLFDRRRKGEKMRQGREPVKYTLAGTYLSTQQASHHPLMLLTTGC